MHGEVGQTQFLPKSILLYGVDGDGNGVSISTPKQTPSPPPPIFSKAMVGSGVRAISPASPILPPSRAGTPPASTSKRSPSSANASTADNSPCPRLRPRCAGKSALSANAWPNPTTRKPRQRKSSRQLAQALGKLVALALVVVAVVLIERYCGPKRPFGPDAKIVSIDGDSTARATARSIGCSASMRRSFAKLQRGQRQAVAMRSCRQGQADHPHQRRQCGVRSARNRPLRPHRRGVQRRRRAGSRRSHGARRLCHRSRRRRRQSLRGAEAEAQAAKRGIWRGTFQRPSDWRQANPRSDAKD